jgi:assimilatory nitrate reductase catalytic subunit
VGANTIAAAVRAGCADVDAVGRKLKAGTNCGSCRPEIGKLIAASQSSAGAVAARTLKAS